MVETQLVVAFEKRAGESEEDLAKLTRELELDLRDIGPVGYLPAAPAANSKSAGEVVSATLSLIATTNPEYVQAVVETVLAFVGRHDNRRAELRVGDVKFTLDRPSRREVARLIDLLESALDSRAGKKPKR